ncbi:hypothetical protein GCM10027294_36160 [Marinactinospora endophytica]
MQTRHDDRDRAKPYGHGHKKCHYKKHGKYRGYHCHWYRPGHGWFGPGFGHGWFGPGFGHGWYGHGHDYDYGYGHGHGKGHGDYGHGHGHGKGKDHDKD